jgi:hypothetical protein
MIQKEARRPDIKPDQLPRRKRRTNKRRTSYALNLYKKPGTCAHYGFIFVQTKSPQVIKRVTDLQNHSNNTSSEGQATESSTDNSGTAG